MARYEIYPLEAEDLCQSLSISRSLTKSQRDAIDDSDFAWPEEQKYPINTQAHLDAAAKLIGRAPADKQAAIKARAIKIAKRKGFTLPESWQEDDKDDAQERSMTKKTEEALTRAVSADHEPMTTTHEHSHPAFGSQGDDDSHTHSHSHSNDNDHHHEHSEDRALNAPAAITSINMYLPITRSVTSDNGDWIVEGQATSDTLDYYDTVFDFESAKKAFARWRGNIREQHDAKKAVGKAIEWYPDEENRAIILRSRISKGAPDTWEKVCDGTLTGYSVSLDPRSVKTEVIQRDGKRVKKYSDYNYLEVSLVDAPGSPGCDIAIVRADGMITDVLDDSEEQATTPTPEPATPEVIERAGARVSKDTQTAMHGGIGHTLKAAVSQMQNCGCEDCQAAMKMIDPDGDGDIDIGGYDDPDNDWQSLYGDSSADTERALSGLIERILEKQLTPVYARLQGIAGALARSNAAPTSLDTVITGAITRAVEVANTANESSLAEVRASLGAVKEQVETIANTPVPGAPVMNTNALPRPALPKQLPTDPIRDPYARPQGSGSAVADAMRQLSEAGYLNSEQKQVDAMAAGLLLQREPRGGR